MAKNIIKKNSYKKTHKNVDYEAIVSLEELKNGLRLADIVSCEDVDVEAFRGKCKVQILRDGHIIIHELPKYYFVFTMPEQLVYEIPHQLKRQAAAIAEKIEEALAIKR